MFFKLALGLALRKEQGFKGGIQGRSLHGKKGDGCTAAAAALAAGDPSGKHCTDPPAEGIHPGDVNSANITLSGSNYQAVAWASITLPSGRTSSSPSTWP